MGTFSDNPTADAAWAAANLRLDAGTFDRAAWDELLAMALALPRPEQDQELQAVAQIGLLHDVVSEDELAELLPEDDGG